ncbi:MAG: hypothetical protein WDN67_03285 [Candidatus Moraniibacteriota bacterium]
MTYWSGTSSLGSEAQLSPVRGGTGLDASSASNGSIPIGNGSGFTLNTLDPADGIDITNSPGLITIGLDVTTTGTTATAASNSGLETTPSGLRLIGGCSNDQVLAWNATSETWSVPIKLRHQRLDQRRIIHVSDRHGRRLGRRWINHRYRFLFRCLCLDSCL